MEVASFKAPLAATALAFIALTGLSYDCPEDAKVVPNYVLADLTTTYGHSATLCMLSLDKACEAV